MKLIEYLINSYYWLQGKCHICHQYWKLCKGHEGEPNEQEALAIAQNWADNGAKNLDQAVAELTVDTLQKNIAEIG